MCIENTTIEALQQTLAAGETTATDLTTRYLARIDAYDRDGPGLNSVREVNPDALAIAAALDARKPATRRPLEGIPILIKDNIATADRQHTTAGSLALAEARARRDATVTRLLRDAGAVILGKANLTEFANILAVDMPSGYSSLGGQVKNPYAPQLDDRNIPIVPPGGSSSGSAVAVAAGLAAAAIGTETSGSLLSPAHQNGLVTVKPTLGLISRAGIIPIAHSQDTAGPMTRTVRVSGPAVSWLWAIGMMPARLINPTVGFTVTTPFWLAGDSREPDVSVPIATAASPTATATAEPELGPPGATIGTPARLSSGAYGFFTWPPSEE